SNEVVLEKGGQGTVDRDRSLGRQTVADTTDRPPRGLAPVAPEADDVGQVGGGDTLTEEAGAAEQPTAGEQRRGVAIGGQVGPDGPSVVVHGAPQDRLDDRVERPAAELIAAPGLVDVADPGGHGLGQVDENAAVLLAGGADLDRLGRLT